MLCHWENNQQYPPHRSTAWVNCEGCNRKASGIKPGCRLCRWLFSRLTWQPIWHGAIDTVPVSPHEQNPETCQVTPITKKALRKTQTQRAGCSKAELKKIFGPPQIPSRGAQDGQNLNSWRCSLPLPINLVWWRSLHAISSYFGNRPTNKHTHKPTERTDYNTLHHS